MSADYCSEDDFEKPSDKLPVKPQNISHLSDGKVADEQQQRAEMSWPKDEYSVVWNASFESVQETWKEMLASDIKENQWGANETECCWEVSLASSNGRPTKELKRLKTRRTKKEIEEGVLLKSTKRVRAYCTHIALRAEQKFPLPRFGKTDASHLCHNPICVRPSHLITEDRQRNHARKNCLLRVSCSCGQDVVVCKHSPPCVRSAVVE